MQLSKPPLANTPMGVNVRFGAYMTQVFCFAWLALRLI